MTQYYIIKKQHGGWVKLTNPLRFIGEAIHLCNQSLFPWVILDRNNEIIKHDDGLTEEDLEQAKKAGRGEK